MSGLFFIHKPEGLFTPECYGKAPLVFQSNSALALQDHHTQEKTNSNKGPYKRREAAVTVSVTQTPLRVFFNPDTCKPFHHDLQWGK